MKENTKYESDGIEMFYNGNSCNEYSKANFIVLNNKKGYSKFQAKLKLPVNIIKYPAMFYLCNGKWISIDDKVADLNSKIPCEIGMYSFQRF